MKKNNKKDKIIQSILFLSLSIGSIAVIIGLWNFLYAADEAIVGNRSRILYPACIVPLLLLYMAIVPWIKFEGFKKEVVGAQLMRLDEEGCYLGPIADFEPEDVQTLTKIFDRESDWRHERFSYRPVAIYLKTTKDGQWFFPDKTDRRLFMTGDPGADTQLIGIKISEEESQIVEELIQKYASCV